MSNKEKAEAPRAKIMGLVQEYAAVAHAPRELKAGESSVPVSGKVYGAAIC